MKKKILLVLILTFLSSISFADEYVLVMSKDDCVCQHMLKLYNEDLKKYGDVKYDKHEEFNTIKWNKKKYYRMRDGTKKYPVYPYDSSIYVLMSRFDMNNDGNEEIIVKQERYLKGILSESVSYIKGNDKDYFKKDEIDVYQLYSKATGSVGTGAFDQNVYELKELPKISIGMILDKETYSHYAFGGHFYVNPFVFKGSYYIDMRQKQNIYSPYQWLVILKYDKHDQIQDICYCLKTFDCKNN